MRWLVGRSVLSTLIYLCHITDWAALAGSHPTTISCTHQTWISLPQTHVNNTPLQNKVSHKQSHVSYSLTVRDVCETVFAFIPLPWNKLHSLCLSHYITLYCHCPRYNCIILSIPGIALTLLIFWPNGPANMTRKNNDYLISLKKAILLFNGMPVNFGCVLESGVFKCSFSCHPWPIDRNF